LAQLAQLFLIYGSGTMKLRKSRGQEVKGQSHHASQSSDDDDDDDDDDEK